MKYRCLALSFFNGAYAINEEDLPARVLAHETTPHGDTKAHPDNDEYMGLVKDEYGDLIDIWSNFYGLWCRVKRDSGQIVDVRPKDLIIQLSDEERKNSQFFEQIKQKTYAKEGK